jgi:hypothetical protein
MELTSLPNYQLQRISLIIALWTSVFSPSAFAEF